jgi:ankyrin repeat domain-containing protein 50
VVKLLLNRGADVQAKDDTGWTALRRATFQGNMAVVKLLN